jgi:hypothetical protein
VQVGSIFEECSGKFDDSIVVFDVVDVKFEKFVRIVVKFFCPRYVDEGQQDSTHTAHDFVLLIESYLVIVCFYDNFFLFLILVQLHLLEDIDRILLFLCLQKYFHCDNTV